MEEVVTIGLDIAGFSIGAENSNSLGYRQSVTPDELQGRMNAAMRSINRAMIVVAASLGGMLADWIGYRPTIALAASGFVAVSLGMLMTPLRNVE